MDFSDILAHSVHDIKNSLGMILNSIDDLLSDPANEIEDQGKARLLQHEASRANNNLIQLLSLYKLEKQQLTVNIAEQNLTDFFDEVVSENQTVCNALGISLDSACDDDLTGYFDEDLVRGVVSGTIGNAQRYARTAIQLSASNEQGFLVIRIEDDGDGYPAGMIEMTQKYTSPEAQSFSAGRTHLGLYFASQVAQLHSANDQLGYVKLCNGRQLPGGCFELWLP